jgi:tetratricopeptide (TPR) repeat protein
LPLTQLLGQAEDHYRNRRQSESEQAFKQVIRRDPLALHAWFRLGNLNHARGDLEGAAQAYRKAIELKPRDAVERDAREKSLANLAIIGLEQARVALERLSERNNSSNARERAGTLAPVLEQRQAALQEEMERLVPRASVKRRVDSLGLALSTPSAPTGTISTPAERIGHVVDVQPGSRIASPVPRVRVESYLPGDFAVQATSAPGGNVQGERAR